MLEARDLTWKQINFNLQKTYVMRDALSCDHFLLFKDIIYCKKLNYIDQEIVQSFYPRIKRRQCESCQTTKAQLLIKNS